MRTAQPLPDSLYAETAMAAPETPVFDADARTSIAIIGAGFAGLSAALHLAEMGVDVTVLEANEPGWGASGRNGGQVNPGLKFNPDALLSLFGGDLGARMITRAYGGPDFTFELIRRLGIDCEARQNGTLRAATHGKALDAVCETARQCHAHLMPTRLLDRDAIQAATGTAHYRGALFDPRGGDLHPLKYARGLAAAAMAAGVRIHSGSRVLSVSRNTGGWLLKTSRASLAADKLLVAVNAYADGLWPGLKQSVVPVYSAIVASEPLPDTLAARILPQRPVLYESSHITVYYRLDRQNRLLMGGRGPQRSFAGDTAPVSYLIRHAERLWPEMKDIRWSHAWNGQLAVTPDHLPHVHEPSPDVLLYLGCNGRGVALATTMGQQLASRLVQGKDAAFDLPISPITPMRFHAFWPMGVHTAMLWGRLRDAMGW
ncbi:NAD(P)/FAD-dependent oxidoreductase [Pararhizobium antarcticum]|uniref:Oxidoreductase n=1 Tax=Pararhizobium antarcticum TaxID=1798805 RepID=A0A657LY43_9HYPH|nr:FAD-dependent oxidoreductase [Pararhizobium antarcticum]OJF91060.1 oxidoreductase [Rhizobium sp. 58]OJF99989.1 oxidoreductase [Pararhizobium antarcticum]